MSLLNIGDLSVSEKQARDMARLAAQSAVAACAVFVIMQTAGLPEKFVGVLSAVLIVQPSIGSTLGEAFDRFLAALVGSAIGIACLIILPDGYGTAAALAFSMLVINAIAAIKPQWRYGVVAAVALSLGAEENALRIALDRSFSIGVGVAVGIITTFLIWPDTAEKRADRYLKTALIAAADRMKIVVKSATADTMHNSEEARQRYHESIEDARKAVGAVRLANAENLKKRLSRTEQLYNSVLILNRVDEEADEAVTSNKAFRDDVEAIRNSGCKIAKGLAEGNAGFEGLLDEIDKNLSSSKRLLSNYEDDPDQDMRTAALVFGLSQIALSLRSLVEAYEDE